MIETVIIFNADMVIFTVEFGGFIGEKMSIKFFKERKDERSGNVLGSFLHRSFVSFIYCELLGILPAEIFFFR